MAGRGASLVCLPEMFSTGFSLETSVTAEALDGPTPTFLRELARESHMFVVGGFVRQHRHPAHVSDRVDPRDAGPTLVVGHHEPPGVDGHTERPEADPTRARSHTDRHEDDIAVNLLRP